MPNLQFYTVFILYSFKPYTPYIITLFNPLGTPLFKILFTSQPYTRAIQAKACALACIHASAHLYNTCPYSKTSHLLLHSDEAGKRNCNQCVPLFQRYFKFVVLVSISQRQFPSLVFIPTLSIYSSFLVFIPSLSIYS